MNEWTKRRTNSTSAKQRPGVTLSRANLVQIPVPEARHLWRGLRVNTSAVQNGARDTKNVFITVDLDGEYKGKPWTCGFEFYYANPESFYCRLITEDPQGNERQAQVPEGAEKALVSLLPPMSGLISEEPELQPGRIQSLLGEGQTAQVLRNICLQVYQQDPDGWAAICDVIRSFYGVDLETPVQDQARGTVGLRYMQDGVPLELSSAGRGMQQTLLLLAHMRANPNSTLLLDEPDAHLEVLRQRQIYNLITETARATGSQIIAASHSEVVLNEAADKDVVVAFVGVPHRIDDRGAQLVKSLKEIGFDQYYQAERKSFVLYLEGSTDLAILRSFARKLQHPVLKILDDAPFVHYVGNQPQMAARHFFGLREAKPNLQGFALFDRLDAGPPAGFAIPCHCWARREIENYFATRDVLMGYAAATTHDDLVGQAQRGEQEEAMDAAIQEVENALRTLQKDPWAADLKVSEEFLPQVFQRYYSRLGRDNRLNKSDFHILVDYVAPQDIAGEVGEVLDKIWDEHQKVVRG